MLTGLLRGHGVAVLPVDANVEAFDALLAPGALGALRDRLESRLSDRTRRRGRKCLDIEPGFSGLMARINEQGRRQAHARRRSRSVAPAALESARAAEGGRAAESTPCQRGVRSVRDLLMFTCGFGQLYARPDEYPILKAAWE
jgi:hypothetical protein